MLKNNKKRTGNRTLDAFSDIIIFGDDYHMSYFSTKSVLFLVPSNRCNEDFDKISKFLSILEKSGVGKIIYDVHKKENEAGRNGYNPFDMFAMIVYCFAKFNGHLREIEDLCLFDLRVMYIMGQQEPDHSVIGKFINKYIVPYQYEIFTIITKAIIEEFNLDITDQFLDGTKIEANANKYKFVWKPTTHHKNLDKKIKELLIEMGYEIADNSLIKSSKVYEILKDYIAKENIKIDSIPNGKGKRLTIEQRNYKKCYQYLIKLLEYEEKERICGKNRKSYYKTDHDATAMVLKEDYYSKTSRDFHAAYNVQVMVSAGIITMYGVFQDRDDHYTFIPMNDLYFKYYGKYPKNECDDSGYGIYINYKYMKEHNIGNYVKFQSWNGESSGKNPQLFYTFTDGIMCLNGCIGKEISFNSKYHQRNKEGKLYKFIGCNKCHYSYKCKARLKRQDENYRVVELNQDYELLKEEARTNLQSPKGIEIRINRSIQVEGTFGQLKQNMQYVRIRRRGMEKVSCEIMLMCLGRNIRKLFTLLDSQEIKNKYWEAPADLENEKFPFPKQKELKQN